MTPPPTAPGPVGALPGVQPAVGIATEPDGAGPPRSRLATVTALATLGLTLAFGWVLVLDLRLYGSLPDPALLPIQIALAAATLVAALGWRWAPAVTAIVAFAAGVGSFVQPVTFLRLTNPEHASAAGRRRLALLIVGLFANSSACASDGHLRSGGRVACGHVQRGGPRCAVRADEQQGRCWHAA